MSKSTFIVLMSAVAVYSDDGRLGSMSAVSPDHHRRKEVKLLETDFCTTAETFAKIFAEDCGLRDSHAQINLDRISRFTYDDQDRVMAMFPKEPGSYIKNINIGNIRVVEKKPIKVTRYKYTTI